MKRSGKGGKGSSRQKKTGKRKVKRLDDSESQQFVEEELKDRGEESHQAREEDDDEAPEEMPISKSGAGFIPLKGDKKRKRKKPRAATAKEESEKLLEKEPAGEGNDEEAIPKKQKRPNRFFERLPGHYFGSQK